VPVALKNLESFLSGAVLADFIRSNAFIGIFSASLSAQLDCVEFVEEQWNAPYNSRTASGTDFGKFREERIST
jgi:hypothetical protein